MRKHCCYAFELRSVLIYANKPIKRGQWSTVEDDVRCMASAQCRDGLVSAGIEAKNRTTREIKMICTIPAAQYIEHRVIMATGAPLNPGQGVKLNGSFHGMTLVTWDQKVDFYIDGTSKIIVNDERTAQYG